MFLDFKFLFHGVCVCTHICMCMCRGLKLVLGVFFNYPPDYFSSLLFFNESRISHWTGLLWTSLDVQLSLGSLVFDSHMPRVQAATIYICWAFYVLGCSWVLGCKLQSSCFEGKANTLSSGTFSLFLRYFLCVITFIIHFLSLWQNYLSKYLFQLLTFKVSVHGRLPPLLLGLGLGLHQGRRIIVKEYGDVYSPHGD